KTTDNHPTYALLSAVIRKYPHIASAAFQTHSDLLFGGLPISDKEWICAAVDELEVVDLPKCGSKYSTCVVPCTLVETIS
ncbi:hypothetical protein BGY98DRAFT_989887, partial [Russula aff. rugulosa BPL654]